MNNHYHKQRHRMHFQGVDIGPPVPVSVFFRAKRPAAWYKPPSLNECLARMLKQARKGLVTRESRLAVELRREHLDAGVRRGDADLAVGGCERFEEPGGVGGA